jgi:hypothetical protein
MSAVWLWEEKRERTKQIPELLSASEDPADVLYAAAGGQNAGSGIVIGTYAVVRAQGAV